MHLRPRSAAIVTACAAEFDLLPSEILSKTRAQSKTRARHLAWYLMRRLLCKSDVEIGKLTGFDHSSVLHGIREVEWWIKKRPEDAESVFRRIRSQIDFEAEAQTAE